MADYLVVTPDLGTTPLGTGGDDQRAAFTQLSANWSSLANAMVWDASTFDLSFTKGINILDGFLALQDVGELEISAGVINVVGSFHRVSAVGGGGGADTLTTINGGGLIRRVLILRGSGGNTITVENNGASLRLSGSDFILDSSNDILVLISVADGVWLEVSRSAN